MKGKVPSTLNVTYFNKYHMIYPLIASYIQNELGVSTLNFKKFRGIEWLLQAVTENQIDIVIISSSSLFDGSFNEVEIRRLVASLCENKRIITVFFAQNMKPIMLKKIASTGINIILSARDAPQELVGALGKLFNDPSVSRYVSRSIKEELKHNPMALSSKEWEVINLINEGYSLSEIASKKCRAMSTISTQKRNAMSKLNVKNEGELLSFLYQHTFF
jgi:two-component system capsular synthesis response regulator RcsB